MGLLTKLFGQEGTIRFEGILMDGRTFSGKVNIEAFNMSNQELEEKLKELMFVEKGVRVSHIYITGFLEK